VLHRLLEELLDADAVAAHQEFSGGVECLRELVEARLGFADAGGLDLEPDLSWWREGRCVFVGDVKYKRESTGAVRGRHSDLYQLLAYGVAADLPVGLLVYPAGEAEPAEHRVRYLDRTLEVLALDLSKPPRDLLVRVGLLARQIRGLAKQVRAARAVL